MQKRLLIPIALVAAVLIALPAAALTETGVEKGVKDALGLDAEGCVPTTNLASPWVEGPNLAYKRDEPRTVAIGGEIDLVGGTLEVEEQADERLLLTPSDALTRFDPRSGRYEDLAPLPRGLNHIGLVAYRGSLYILGGYGNRVDTHTGREFYRYDPGADRWSRMPDMPEPRAAAATGVIGHTLILAGGARDRVPLADTFAFDFDSRRWSRLPDMGSRREHVGAAVLGGKLYVLGGRAPESLAVDTAERYDPRSREWAALPPMPVPAGGLAAVATDDEVIAIGGGNDEAGTVTGAVQAFDPATGKWTRLPDLRTPRHGHGAAATAGKIWVFGGSACAYFNATERVESLPVPRPSRSGATQ